MNNTLKDLKVSIRVTTMSLFICVFVLLAGMALGLQYLFSLKLADEAAKHSFENASDQAREHLEILDQQNTNLVKVAANYVELGELPKGFGTLGRSEYPILPIFTDSMRRNRYLSAVYVTTDGEDFLELVNLDGSNNLRERLGARPDDRWVLVVISKEVGPGLRKLNYYNDELKLREAKVEPSSYVPSERPWYRLATEKQGVVRTTPYVFQNAQVLGLTYAMKLDSGAGVVGLDMSLEGLFDYLSRQEHFPGSELTFFNLAGKVFAHGRVGPKGSEPVKAQNDNVGPSSRYLLGLALPDKGKPELGRFHLDEDFYYYAEHINFHYNTTLYLGITVPVSVVTGPYIEQIKFSTFITLLLLLLLSPVVWWFASLIVRPINALCHENDKIGLRQFEDVKLVDTRIKEIFELSQSIMGMAKAIREYEDAQHNLLDAIIKLIAGAIDAKSPYTGGHCARVPVIANLLAQAACAQKKGPFASFELKNQDAWREFKIAAWLHDCGKLTTPEYVVDKATKLETIYNRIHEIRTRFEVLLRDAEISYYQRLVTNKEDVEALKAWLENERQAICDDFAFVAGCNIGSEFMSEEKMNRLHKIAQRTWIRNLDNRIGLSHEKLSRMENAHTSDTSGVEHALSDRPEHVVERLQDPFGGNSRGFLMDVPASLYNRGELYNLCVSRGTLSPEERFKINEHIIQTINMLEALPFPRGLERVSEFAGAHHETLIGTGYPRKLCKKDMSVAARIMAIADVFEALTAADRPYKTPKTISNALQIMASMAGRKHLDPELFELFIRSGVFNEYARQYLAPSQQDTPDISALIAVAFASNENEQGQPAGQN